MTVSRRLWRARREPLAARGASLGAMATILLTGDAMIGRGIDQILPHPLDPVLYESFMTSARGYVRLAETRSGPIPRRAAFDYIWGEALETLRSADATIVNLETALTRSKTPAPRKGIHYRCNPKNVPCLVLVGIDCCVLGNNHVLDWGEAGLVETLSTLDAVRMKHAGAGHDLAQAEAPAVLPLGGDGRVLVYSLGSVTSGVPPGWAASARRPGVHLLADYAAAFRRLSARIAADKRHGDTVVVSIHWGPNWGYEVPDADRTFARLLVDAAAVDIVHGHSSHHPKGIELYKGRPILYGCGDFLNDYEGISGQEEYRANLVLAYRLSLGLRDRAWSLEMIPFVIKRFRLHHADARQAEWLRDTMDRECRPLGGRVRMEPAPGEAFRLRLVPA